MEAVTLTRTQEVLDHHLSAFIEADVNEILKDFTEESELLTPDDALRGLDAIRSFFEEVFKIIPRGSTLEMNQMIIRGNVAYIAWNCESQFVSIPIGIDSFIMEHDKIKYQTLAAHIIPRQS